MVRAIWWLTNLINPIAERKSSVAEWWKSEKPLLFAGVVFTPGDRILTR
jgi:hypothetical protein